MYKLSKYNYFHHHNDVYLGINCMSRQMVTIDKYQYSFIENNDLYGLEGNYSDLFKQLVKQNYIVDCHIDEFAQMVRRRNYYVFNQKSYNLTIMPTQECNFKCWYCYESHQVGMMSKASINKVKQYVNSILDNYELDEFSLSWFGGEPLLYFNEVVAPLSAYIKSECEQKNIKFKNSITTNGYYIKTELIDTLKDIGLDNFQITLDGYTDYHEKVKPNSYERIIDNIHLLVLNIENVHINLRFNYTNRCLATLHLIANDFDTAVRTKIEVSFHRVWQTVDTEDENVDLLNSQKERLKMNGFIVEQRDIISPKGYICYADSNLQSVINFDLLLYKCTARDFKVENSVGYISDNGAPIYNQNYAKYGNPVPFDNAKCRNCNILPLCLGTCCQRFLESNNLFVDSLCKKAQLEELLNKKLVLTCKTIQL